MSVSEHSDPFAPHDRDMGFAGSPQPSLAPSDSEGEIAFILARYDHGALPPAIWAVISRLRDPSNVPTILPER